MAHDLIAYPTSLPSDVLTKALEVLRGKFGDPKEDVHYLEHVQMYCVGKFYSDGPQPVESGAVTVSCSNPTECADVLEKCCDESRGMRAEGKVPWGKIIKVLLPVILSLFA